MFRSIALALFLVLLVLLAVLALFSAPLLAAQPAPLRIGILADDPVVFAAARRALTSRPLSSGDINVELIARQVSKEDEYTAALNELFDKYKATLLIGADSMRGQKAVLRIVSKHPVPFISIADLPPEQKERTPLFYRVGPNRGHLLVALQGALQKLKFTTLVLLKNASAEPANAILRRAFPQLKFDYIATGMTHQKMPAQAALYVPSIATNDMQDWHDAGATLGGAPVFVEGSRADVPGVQNLVFLDSAGSIWGDDRPPASTDVAGRASAQFEARAFAAMQMVLEALRDDDFRKYRDGASFDRAIRNNLVPTAMGKLDFRGGGECAILPVAATTRRGEQLFATRGAACLCVDKACCQNCCEGKNKSCLDGKCD